MWRILFLILALMCSTAFAQTSEKKDAYKFFEYENISNKLLEEKLQSLCQESDKTFWIGWIINFGTDEEILNREKAIRKIYSETFRSACHDSRIMFLRIEDKDKSKTEFWIVPPGEEPPPIKKK